MHPNERVYTFWRYMRQRWERDAGLRLDHLLLSPPLAPRLEDAGVDRAVRGLENASDPAPVWVKLRPLTELGARKRKGHRHNRGEQSFARVGANHKPGRRRSAQDHEITLGWRPEGDDHKAPTAGD